ncbi:MAG: Smr/MutS family protein [Candidatus Fermentibacteraceae bacterium]
MPGTPEPLEFTRILRDVAGGCLSEQGAMAVLGLQPTQFPERALELQTETEEAEMLSAIGLGPPVDSIRVLEESLALLERGAIYLEPLQLREVGLAASGFARFRSAACGVLPPAVPLGSHVSGLPVLESLFTHLLRITTPEGELSPGASPKFAKLFSQVERMRREMSARVAELASRYSASGVLRDSPPSLRNGRFVLPVSSGKRGSVSGIIHDRSESGSTLFIEPSEMVEQGNAMQEAEVELQREKRRILRDATAMVRAEREALERGLEASVGIDAVFARAIYRARENTVFPGSGPMNLLGLRHPLIPRDRVVRSDLTLPDSWRVLVISGPNAGGKSVLMKAAALASVMSRSGLGACVEPGSTMPFFRSVMVSMGDNQSIAEQLSTYSARLAEQRGMLEDADETTLAVIDEPAAGTDPSTGAALAAAVLSELASRGVRVLVSTHMGQLKKMASETPGFLNGSLAFDRETLSPSYSFIYGWPGASFTLEVAGAAGIDRSVLEKARVLAGDSFRLDNLLLELTMTNETRTRETEALAAERLCEAEAARARESEHRNAVEELSLLIDINREEHRRKLQDISSRADSLMAVLSRGGAGAGEAREARRKIRELVTNETGNAQAGEAGMRSSSAPAPLSTGELSPGDWVDLEGWNQPGRVESIDGATARVRSGSFLLTRPVSSLSRRNDPAPVPVPFSEWAPFKGSHEVNLLGKTVDEAIGELDERIDSAVVCGLFRLRVVHGKGTLMSFVTGWLKKDRRVKSLTQASPAEGGTGASIVILKDGS